MELTTEQKQFAEMMAMMGSLQTLVGVQGQQTAQTIKDGEVAQTKGQEEFAGVVKHELIQTVTRTENLVEKCARM